MNWQKMMGRTRFTLWSQMGTDYMAAMANKYREENLKNPTDGELKFEKIIKEMKLSYLPQKIFFLRKSSLLLIFTSRNTDWLLK